MNDGNPAATGNFSASTPIYLGGSVVDSPLTTAGYFYDVKKAILLRPHGLKVL
ncbi:MAG: hypothetical protein ABIN13_18065 [Mucilaginibacter sp.]